MDSVKAAKLLQKYFPQDRASSSIVVVVEGSKERMAEVAKPYLDGLSEWLSGSYAPPHVLGVLSSLKNPELGERFKAKDGEAEFLAILLDTGFADPETVIATKRIYSHLNPPSGTKVYLTGDAVLGHDYLEAVHTSVNRSVWITVLLVIILLLIIYRSPITPIIALVPVVTAFVISQGVLALIGISGVTLPDTLSLFLVVLIFGAGTDYCVFLIGRFSEEFRLNQDAHNSAIESTSFVGEAITSSAGTIMVGLTALALAEFGAIGTVGPSLALSIFITLLASITMIPAILAISGKWSLWPHRMQGLLAGWKWLDRLGQIVTTYPRRALIIGLVIPLPFIFVVGFMHRSYDLFAELPPKSWSVVGFKTLERHFPSGEIAPVTIFVGTNENFKTPPAFDDLYRMTNLIQNTDGVSLVFAPSQPLADPKLMLELAVPEQLLILHSGLDRAQEGVRLEIEGMQKISNGVTQFSQAIDKKYQTSLPLLRELASNEYKQAKDGLDRLQKGVGELRLGLEQLQGGLARIGGVIGGYGKAAHLAPRYLDHLYLPPKVIENNPRIQRIFKTFISDDGRSAKLIALQDDPLYSHNALDTIQRLRKRIDMALSLNTSSIDSVHLSGPNPLMADIRDVTITDQKKVIIAAIVGIFLILVLLFRKIWIPTYLLFTMLFNYGVTMGITVAVFQYGLGYHGLDWKVPFLSFVLLVALGIDYNILIMYRIREEQQSTDPKTAIRRALSKSGGVIIACGLILAGTISSLLFTELQLMREIGFAVSFGLLLVTFVVVTIIVPAIAVISEEWQEKWLIKQLAERKRNSTPNS